MGGAFFPVITLAMAALENLTLVLMTVMIKCKEIVSIDGYKPGVTGGIY